MEHQEERRLAENLAKLALQSDRLVALLVRKLRAHYIELSCINNNRRDANSFLIIEVACDDLIRVLEDYEDMQILHKYKGAGEKTYRDTDFLLAEYIVRDAIQSEKMVSLLVSRLSAHYSVFSRREKGKPEEVFLLRICLAFERLVEALRIYRDMQKTPLSLFEDVPESRKSTEG